MNMKCDNCHRAFPGVIKIDGKVRNLASRRYCLDCSPWGSHNTRPLPRRHQDQDDKIIEAVKKSISMAEVLTYLGRSIVGSNYKYIKKHIARLKLDTSHWKGQAHGKTGKLVRIHSASSLTANSFLKTSTIKNIVMREKLVPYKCAICGMGPVWKRKKLTLRLDHENGIRNDHRLTNLRFLCPNCDSQTDTYCGRNKRARARAEEGEGL